MEPLISTRDAEQRILSSCGTTGMERVPLMQAVGRVLAEPLVADRPLPPFPRAMMDGIAFDSRKNAGLTGFTIAGLHAAGDPPPRQLRTGEAWEIMTGAAVPDDCDTVIPYEDLGESFAPLQPFTAGQCIHPRGLDAAGGEVLVRSGCRLRPPEIAIAASIGASTVAVFRKPRVALVTTGDEVVPVDALPAPWQIRRSNGPMLEAALLGAGYALVHHGHVMDDPEGAGTGIDAALAACDVLILCGGISKGRKDFIGSIISERLGAPAFHGVRQRPGKPMAYWPGPPRVFALPGNPVSVLATFTRYVNPALAACEGLAPHWPPLVELADAEPLPHFTWLLTVARDGNGRLTARAPRNSGDYISIAGCSGIVEIPAAPDFTPGQALPFHSFT